MIVHATQSQLDLAALHEQVFVPAELQEWTAPLIKAAGVEVGQSVLDVACGTGVLARAVSQRIGPTGRIVGIDPDLGMLAVAKETTPSIDYRQGVAESLPFANEFFDAVLSQFGLMYFSERVAAVREMLRVLRPGRRMAVAVWDALEHTPAYLTLAKVFDRLAGPQVGDVFRSSYSLGDTQELAMLFLAADARDVRITTHIGTARFPDIRTMVTAELRDLSPAAGVVLEPAQVERVLLRAERCLAPHCTPDGSIRFAARAHIVTVTKTALS
jgi:ubiquinone/menaquinone biosynthesis C-methylase UbiE